MQDQTTIPFKLLIFSLILIENFKMVTTKACLQDDKTNSNFTNSSLPTNWTSLAEYCTEVHVVMQHCKCPTCANEFESRIIDEYQADEVYMKFNKTTKDFAFHVPSDIKYISLEKLYQAFGIENDDCSCSPYVLTKMICNSFRMEQRINPNNVDGYPSVMATITTLSIIGNLLVLAVTKHKWRTSSTSSKLVGALALSDFLFSAIILISEIHTLWTTKWIHGLYMCKLLIPAINMTATMALGFILIISIERFFGIVYPFKQIITITKVYIMSLLNILISLIVVIPPVIVLDTKDDVCKEEWSDDSYSLIYSWFLFFATFFLSLIHI